jgi:dTDP-4-dehydrorhamnose reductase
VIVLLTGANGQIGWELRRSLSDVGDVLALDRTTGDLSRPGDLPDVIRTAKPEIIVNAAAYTDVDRAEDEEHLATTVNGTAVGVMAEESRKLGGLFIHYSTDYVFDGTKESPYDEDDAPSPINAYGRSKLVGEHATAQSGSDYLILRTSWVFSARGRNFLRTILQLSAERDHLSIVADQIGAPTWARHVADATALLARRACEERVEAHFTSGILNLVARGATSWYGFAKAILDNANAHDLLRNKPKVHPIASSQYIRPAARPKNSCLSSERLRARFGLALAEWEEALSLCMQDESLNACASAGRVGYACG